MTRLRSASTMWTTLLYALPLFLFALFLPHPASAGKGAPITELDRVASAVEGAEPSRVMGVTVQCGAPNQRARKGQCR